jgi:phosphoribosyl 1,2-cyclic phosphate phosphodiesterase
MGFDIISIRLQHGNLPILGFRIKNFAYLTDVNFIPEESLEKLYNLDILVIDALHHKSHHSHFNIQEAIEVIGFLKPEKAYLTHISHSMGLHGEVEKELPENVFLGYDGLQFNL